MIILVVLEGASSSSRDPKYRIGHVACQVLEDNLAPCKGFIDFPGLLRFAATKALDFIEGYDSPENTLLLVGKSAGGKAIASIANRLGPLQYRKIAFVTVDINWPLFFDWKPNLNNKHIFIKRFFDHIENVYQEPKTPKGQAGCQVMDQYGRASNYKIRGYDHITIMGSPQVRNSLTRAVQVLRCTTKSSPELEGVQRVRY